jgi:hypothetical protein
VANPGDVPLDGVIEDTLGTWDSAGANDSSRGS